MSLRRMSGRQMSTSNFAIGRRGFLRLPQLRRWRPAPVSVSCFLVKAGRQPQKSWFNMTG